MDVIIYSFLQNKNIYQFFQKLNDNIESDKRRKICWLNCFFQFILLTTGIGLLYSMFIQWLNVLYPGTSIYNLAFIAYVFFFLFVIFRIFHMAHFLNACLGYPVISVAEEIVLKKYKIYFDMQEYFQQDGSITKWELINEGKTLQVLCKKTNEPEKSTFYIPFRYYTTTKEGHKINFSKMESDLLCEIGGAKYSVIKETFAEMQKAAEI